MLLTHSQNLPPEQRQRLHPDFLANERDYMAMRDQLLPRYRGQWVAVHDGQLIAADADLIAVTRAAGQVRGHPYIARVGEEDTTVFRLRVATFGYDRSYLPFPLPLITVTFWNDAETRTSTYSDVVADTGADMSALPGQDCAAFDLFDSPYFTAVSSGVIGASVTTVVYQGKAEINGLRTPAFIQPIPSGTERIVGRDVLNHHRAVFDGPAGQVIFEP